MCNVFCRNSSMYKNIETVQFQAIFINEVYLRMSISYKKNDSVRILSTGGLLENTSLHKKDVLTKNLVVKGPLLEHRATAVALLLFFWTKVHFTNYFGEDLVDIGSVLRGCLNEWTTPLLS